MHALVKNISEKVTSSLGDCPRDPYLTVATELAKLGGGQVLAASYVYGSYLESEVVEMQIQLPKLDQGDNDKPAEGAEGEAGGEAEEEEEVELTTIKTLKFTIDADIWCRGAIVPIKIPLDFDMRTEQVDILIDGIDTAPFMEEIQMEEAEAKEAKL